MSLLVIKNLTIGFGKTAIVKGISFQVGSRECVGLVGESGSGKSLTAHSILLPVGTFRNGEILFEEKNLLNQSNRKMQAIRGKKIGMIFQEPMTALNPLMTIGKQIVEILQRHEKMTKNQAKEKTLFLLERVGIPEPSFRIKQYPFEFSGGMRQRVMIAMAIACNPSLLIADEPTTALDVTLQEEILELLQSLQKERNLSMLFISHDLKVIQKLCNRVLVMHQGEIVEEGSTEKIFSSPQHPYTQKLFSWRRKK